MSGMTFAEKALARAASLAATRAGEIVEVSPDRILSHDNTAAIARIFYQELGARRIANPEKVCIVLDHASPPPTPKHAQNHAETRAFVQEQGIRHFFDVGYGICHQVLSESGLVLPGNLILGADSHTTHYGWLGAFGAGLGRTEVAVLWATDRIWLRVPESILIRLHGTLPSGVTAKDVCLYLSRELGADGGLYTSVEFSGPGLSSLSLESRMVIANSMAEIGAKNAYLLPDARVFEYLAVCSGQSPERLRADALYPDENASYLAEYDLFLDRLEPMVACPHSVENVQPLSAMVGRRVDMAFLGTCTNGRLEDLAAAAEVLRGRRIHPRTRLLVIPASQQVLQQAARQGIVEVLLEAGAMIGVPGCGPCMGNHLGIPAAGEVVISTANRNFKGRMGQPEAEIYLASPAIVAASAVLGRIASPLEVEGKALPARSAAPPAFDSRRAETQTTATRLSATHPAPSGSFRPHGRVWKYGDNVNTDQLFPGKHTYTAATPEEIAAHALEDLDPSFAAAVQAGDVIFGGQNFGCGSSREQAVTCLKYKGVRALVACSFARIFYRNAINQGLAAIVCPSAVEAAQAGDPVEVDLAAGVVRLPTGEFPFPPFPPHLRAIIEAGGLVELVRNRQP